MRRIKLLFIIFLISSCAHRPESKLSDRPYMKDQVSVQTVLMQARAAYVRGCLNAYKEVRMKGRGFKYCSQKADDYLKSDVISILEQ